MIKICVSILSLVLMISFDSVAFTQPNPALTPGVLCTPSDPDYRGPDYPEGIARCNRNILDQEKKDVSAKYGNIPQSDWPKYEFDHMIPLCAGGSNNPQNLWPQPIVEAKKKDLLEVDICTKMRAGTLKQAAAVQMVRDWFQANAQTPSGQALSQLFSSVPVGRVHCVEQVKVAKDSTLLLDFSKSTSSEIFNPQVQISEAGQAAEVTSASGAVQGKLSRAYGSPLRGYYLFSVIENKDRFDLYLPETRNQSFTAFIKLSFEDTYPKLVRMNCENALP